MIALGRRRACPRGQHDQKQRGHTYTHTVF
jgi:hypothetical protein